MDPIYLLPVMGGVILETYGFWIKKTDEKVDKHEAKIAVLDALWVGIDKKLDKLDEKLEKISGR